jgi:aminopeptidase N
MSFVDVDKNQYLYTTFEPHFAHRVFALFDQPDLKAAMTLSVTCPLAWTKVLSN